MAISARNAIIAYRMQFSFFDSTTWTILSSWLAQGGTTGDTPSVIVGNGVVGEDVLTTSGTGSTSTHIGQHSPVSFTLFGQFRALQKLVRHFFSPLTHSHVVHSSSFQDSPFENDLFRVCERQLAGPGRISSHDRWQILWPATHSQTWQSISHDPLVLMTCAQLGSKPQVYSAQHSPGMFDRGLVSIRTREALKQDGMWQISLQTHSALGQHCSVRLRSGTSWLTGGRSTEFVATSSPWVAAASSVVGCTVGTPSVVGVSVVIFTACAARSRRLLRFVCDELFTLLVSLPLATTKWGCMMRALLSGGHLIVSTSGHCTSLQSGRSGMREIKIVMS